VFDDMLKKPCPYHKTPVNHTLEQCDLLKRYYSRAAAKDGEAKKDGGDGNAGGFPAVENVFLIFRGPTVDMSNSQRKQERHEVLVAEKAPPSFLDWSEDAITFIREDHPNRIPNLGQYLLVVDPVIGNARFSKVLMDRARQTTSARKLSPSRWWGSEARTTPFSGRATPSSWLSRTTPTSR
jgi:hypothetical protein